MRAFLLCAMLLAAAMEMSPAAHAATAAPAAPTSFGFIAPVRIDAVDIDTVDGVFASDPDRAVILEEIRSRLKSGLPDASESAPHYRMMVLLTRFSRGTAAARMSLIGLGGVHVEGKVRLSDSDGKLLPDVAIAKGLVIGGLAGGLVSSDSVISRFANAVVASVQPVKSPAEPPQKRN